MKLALCVVLVVAVVAHTQAGGFPNYMQCLFKGINCPSSWVPIPSGDQSSESDGVDSDDGASNEAKILPESESVKLVGDSTSEATATTESETTLSTEAAPTPTTIPTTLPTTAPTPTMIPTTLPTTAPTSTTIPTTLPTTTPTTIPTTTPFTTTTTVPTTVTTPSTTTTPKPFACTAVGTFPDPASCLTYYRCTSTMVSYKYTCPGASYFNATTLKCTATKPATCP